MRILLADDHRLFLQSLKMLLTSEGHEVIGEARNGREAFELARRLRPDLILMDIDMPECSGLAATRLIKAEMPETKVVMLTVSATDEHLFEAIKSGASGYLLKSQDATALLNTVALVRAGGAALAPELAARVLAEFARIGVQRPDGAQDQEPALTPRQIEVLTLVAEGFTYRQISELLHLSFGTVRYHMGEIMDRLHVASRAEVIAYAAMHGLSGQGKHP